MKRKRKKLKNLKIKREIRLKKIIIKKSNFIRE
jgi:hypothetical protein